MTKAQTKRKRQPGAGGNSGLIWFDEINLIKHFFTPHAGNYITQLDGCREPFLQFHLSQKGESSLERFLWYTIVTGGPIIQGGKFHDDREKLG
ncbi:MAG: hypothetical protein Fur0044_24410 [Anaerolineae bacterium]|nr:hypothetical protein [Anaerolineae bacterium]